MVTSPWPQTGSRSSWEAPTMQFDTMDTVNEDAMKEEDAQHKEKEDQDFDDKTFAAMRIMEVQLALGSASSSDGAHV